MPTIQNNGVLDAIVAVATRLEFLRAAQRKLNELLKLNPSLVNEYMAKTAQIDVERLKWEAELDALANEIPPVTPPTPSEVEALQAAVQALTAKVEAANAFDAAGNIIAEAAAELRR
ncbi:MAG: hypothetical protein E6R14_05335 [Thermomicrobiales bacterium]|nr:MAG: hypothetical protein E6R14_05335 [Thermomicrobiales bacterium]